MRPSRVCSTPGCPQFEPCPTHPKERNPDERRSSTARGYGGRWRTYSEGYRRSHPHCKPCQDRGLLVPTEIVDHIIPVTGPTDPRFWAKDNHQPLCRPCHAVKTHAEGRTQGTIPPEPKTWVIA